MNARILIYVLAQFLLSVAGGVALCVTPKDWVIALCFAGGNALIAGLAKWDNTGAPGGNPPPAKG